jgi:hypothetical protein
MPIEKWPKGPTNLAREPLRVTAPLRVAEILAVATAVTKAAAMAAIGIMITVIMITIALEEIPTVAVTMANLAIKKEALAAGP